MKKLLLALLVAVSHNCNAQIINTIAGTGILSYSGDGGAAIVANLNVPQGLAIDTLGNIYVCDILNHRIRKINELGVISTFAGTGSMGFSGDGGPATAAQLNTPYNITLDRYGNVYVADGDNNRIRKINCSGIISTIAGNGSSGYSGDGGAATIAALFHPSGIVVDSSMTVFFTDARNNRVRKISSSGIITTIAGSGLAGFSGDGGAATAAIIDYPVGIFLDHDHTIYFADYNNSRIRKIDTLGIISTVAGTGSRMYSGDGGAATAAGLNRPWGIASDGSGCIYIADEFNYRVRKISSTGIIQTIAGTGSSGYSGDGGTATAADIGTPIGIAVDNYNNVYFSDGGGGRVRKIFTASATSTISGHNQNALKIFPIPAKGICNIELPEIVDEANIRLMDLTGKVVIAKTNYELGMRKIVLNIENIIPGYYLIAVKCSDKIYSAPVMIE